MMALPDGYIARAGRRITERLLQYPPLLAARSVFLYVSVGREPDTRELLRRLLADGKRVYVPKCLSPGEMAAVRIRSEDELVPGALGIPEPARLEETAAADGADVILVPCLAASPGGARLGHGGGYYDRFLGGGPHGLTVCLCYEKLLTDDIPLEATDVMMDAVMTEDREYKEAL